MKVDDQLMWHEILAAVLRCYGGATLLSTSAASSPGVDDLLRAKQCIHLCEEPNFLSG